MKETFENIEVQIITIVSEDVIATSGGFGMFSTELKTGDKNDFGGNIL